MHRRNEPIDLAIEAISADDSRALCHAIDGLGLDITAVDNSGAPLMFFCVEGRTNCLRFLLSRGANPDQPCPDGTTPAMRSSRACPDCMKLLFSNGASWHARDQAGRNILHHSAAGLSKHARIALHWACENAPADLFSQTDFLSRTPLISCALVDNAQAAKLVAPKSPLLAADSEHGLHALGLCLRLGKASTAIELWPFYQIDALLPSGGALLDLARWSRETYGDIASALGLQIALAERLAIEQSSAYATSSSGSKSL